jgi:hypothetical protein
MAMRRSVGAPHLLMGLDFIDWFMSGDVSIDWDQTLPVQVQVQVQVLVVSQSPVYIIFDTMDDT